MRQTEPREFYDSSKWEIDPQVIQPFLRRCSVDLFASGLTALLPTYASWKLDLGATYTDAMTFDLSLLKSYAFPPFSLNAPVPKNISQDKGDVVLVASVWQAQPWWPALLNLLIKNLVMIPNSKHLLRNPASPPSIHPMYPRLLHLAVFHLSGNSIKQKGFQRTLPQHSNQQLVPSHIGQTSRPGDYGTTGVLNETFIQFLPPWMMSSSSWPIALTTGQPKDQSMWHVQLYPTAILRLTATLLVNILSLFNFKKECLT